MSYAIFDLDLEMPPVSVIRVRREGGDLHWIAQCEMCGRRGTPRPLLSAALRCSYDHGRAHAGDMLRIVRPQPVRRETAVKPRPVVVRGIVAAPTRRDAA